jgi:hypothetical protein
MSGSLVSEVVQSLTLFACVVAAVGGSLGLGLMSIRLLT